MTSSVDPRLKKEKIAELLSREPIQRLPQGTLCFRDGDHVPRQTAGNSFIGHLQDFLKTFEGLYKFLLLVLGPNISSWGYRKCVRELLNRFDLNATILNVGSGPSRFYGREDIINVDMFAFPTVDIAADAADLPIKDGSVDCVICVAMMEHVPNPVDVVAEMYRVCKPGGCVLCYLPFLVPYHAAPHDYSRWTESGARVLFSNYSNVEVMVGVGPTSALNWMLQEWLATLLSFGNRTLHDLFLIFFMVILFPLKYVDLLIDWLPTAKQAPSGFLVLAKRP